MKINIKILKYLLIEVDDLLSRLPECCELLSSSNPADKFGLLVSIWIKN